MLLGIYNNQRLRRLPAGVCPAARRVPADKDIQI